MPKETRQINIRSGPDGLLYEENQTSLSFVPVTVQDKPTVDRYMGLYGESSCQHSFAALYTLSEKYGSRICEKDGFLFTLREGLCTEGKRVYLAPLGDGDRRSAYSAILNDAAAHHCRAVFRTVTKEQVAFLKKNFPGRFRYTELRDYAEYIYLTDALCRMEGSQFANKRNRVRKLWRTYGERLEVRPLSRESIADIRRFEEKWLVTNAADHDRAALEMELRTIRMQLEHFELLCLSGIGVYIDGEMVAFAYGIPLNDGCFDGLIAKADRSIRGLYVLLYQSISRLCAVGHTYFNWEEDVGVEGLRNTKTEYGPVVLMRKYLAEETDTPSDVPETDDIPVLSSVDIGTDEPLFPGSLDELQQAPIKDREG